MTRLLSIFAVDEQHEFLLECHIYLLHPALFARLQQLVDYWNEYYRTLFVDAPSLSECVTIEDFKVDGWSIPPVGPFSIEESISIEGVDYKIKSCANTYSYLVEGYSNEHFSNPIKRNIYN